MPKMSSGEALVDALDKWKTYVRSQDLGVEAAEQTRSDLVDAIDRAIKLVLEQMKKYGS